MRIEPPVSVPRATPQAPAPTRAAEPPLEPPAVRPGPKGLRASGTPGCTAPAAYSSSDVAAKTSAPASRRAATTAESLGAGAAPMSCGLPFPRGCPAYRRLGQYLPGDRQHQRPPPWVLQGAGDRQAGHRPGVQHGPVRLLAPQKPHDVAGGLGVGQRPCQL